MEYYRSFYYEHCIYLPAMLGWFVFSACISSYNKYVFSPDHYDFPYPLFMTSIHFLTQWIFSYIACTIAPSYFGSTRITHQMSWNEWIWTSVPCGIVTSGDVGLSNLAIARMTLTFYTMVKSSTPIFVLFWAYLFGIERITPILILVVVIIAAGEYLTVLGQTEYNKIGFVMCLCASMLSGARWTLVQLKLRSLDPPLKTTIATMRLLSPSMFLSLLFVSLVIEKPWIKLVTYSIDDALIVIGLSLLGAFFAISMVLCEFYLIMNANAIVLMIGGVLKEMVTIFIGVTFFDDILNSVNISGCIVVFCGVALYKMSHYMDTLKQQHTKIDDDESIDMRTIDGSSSNNNNGNNGTPTTTLIKDEMASISLSSHNNSNGGRHFRVPASPFRKYERISTQDNNGNNIDSSLSSLSSSGPATTEKDGLLLVNNNNRLLSDSGGGMTELRRNSSHHESKSSSNGGLLMLRPSEGGLELRRNASNHENNSSSSSNGGHHHSSLLDSTKLVSSLTTPSTSSSLSPLV